MADDTKKPLKVFLCHASGDKPFVRELYKSLITEGVDAWLDEEKLLPGQDWGMEIPRAVRESDVVVICLSNKSITKEGYVQKEIKSALDIAEEKPEGTIFLIPARLEDCIVPGRLDRWQWVDLFHENGFLKLLRSLKLRADKVGAVIEPAANEDLDSEVEQRLDQLYTEGLAAFWVEDWDRACQRFQAILRERPKHQNAAEKLAQAERQRSLAKLYAQGTEAYKSEHWADAIKVFEGLLEKSPDYKDSVQLLKDARKQKQLRELYLDAQRLHAAQKWQAVVRVFDQIAALDLQYPDPENLLSSAQQEAAEQQRLDELTKIYRQGVHQMDAGEWYEAHRLLEQVHKAQIGFLETERLLRKVEDEIKKIEELNQRNIHVNTLYEQVHDLARSKNWRKALEKIEEIQKLDDHFADTDGIFEKAKMELEREEQEAQRQQELNSLYAEAVSLLQAKKYQEALEKWNEVQAIDPTYRDVSRVKATAKRKLDELSSTGVADQAWQEKISAWFAAEANIPVEREILTERLLLLSFVAIAIIVEVYLVVVALLRVREAGVVPGFLSRFVLGGLYGAVVGFTLSKTISSWHRKQSLTVIFGWALAQSVPFIVRQYFAIDFATVYALFAGLSTMIAIRWARPLTRFTSLVAIFVSWMLVWKAGVLLGVYLQSVFNNLYITNVTDPFSVMLGLLFTFGFQIEETWKVIRMAFLGALGFAIANYISYLVSLVLVPFPAEIIAPLGFAVWGLLGGAMLEIPSRDLRRILSSAVVCGFGLLVGSFAAFDIFVPLGSNSALADPFTALRQPFMGVGLGLAFGFLIRRISATGVMLILGMGMFILTRAITVELHNDSPFWANIVRGALIGLALGFAYGYMRKAESPGAESLKAQRSMQGTNLWGNIVFGLVILSGLAVIIFMNNSRTLFFDDFDQPTLRNVYGKFPLTNQGPPKYTFEMLDGSSVLRLKNTLSDNQRIGWQVSTGFDVYSTPFRLEIRFNTLRQSPVTSIDGFFEIWLFDANNSSSNYVVGLSALDYGSTRTFLDRRFNFSDNTWYRLVIIGTKEQRYKASLYNDSLEKELVGSYLPYDPNIFKSGMKLGIEQFMGTPGGFYPVDVAIDWIKLTLNPKP